MQSQQIDQNLAELYKGFSSPSSLSDIQNKPTIDKQST